MDSTIPSNKTYLPPREEYERYLDEIWESGWVTNDGDLLQTLEAQLADYFEAEHVRVVANGTMALRLAIRVLGVEGEVITTPFSYVATTGALLWERCDPVFADINPETFNLDPQRAEAAIGAETGALLPTHVFGVPCDVPALQSLADRHDLNVIYDGAHAFGTTLGGRSLLTFGDLTAASFHATKLFHTIEGGALITDDAGLAEQIGLMRAFGHQGNEHFRNGINAKNSELHAAMGLCLLPRMETFIERRREMYELYRNRLQHLPLTFQCVPAGCDYNCAYFPALFPSHEAMMAVKGRLEQKNIHTRRYFTPALNRLPYVDAPACPVAEDVAERVLCLPFFQEITTAQVERVAAAIDEVWPATD